MHCGISEEEKGFEGRPLQPDSLLPKRGQCLSAPGLHRLSGAPQAQNARKVSERDEKEEG
jgi:hypothetical protein